MQPSRLISLKSKMLRYRCILLGLLFASPMMATALDCSTPPVPDARMLGHLAKTVQPDRGVLWKVSRNGKDSFLYGVVHVAKLEWDFPGPTILDALKRSAYLVVEVDTTELTFAQKLQEKTNNIAAQIE